MILKDKWDKEISPTLDAERQATGICYLVFNK